MNSTDWRVSAADNKGLMCRKYIRNCYKSIGKVQQGIFLKKKEGQMTGKKTQMVNQYTK